MGRGISEALADDGCNVVICSRNEDEVRQAAKEIEERGTNDARALAVVADLTEEADRRRLVDETLNEFCTLDILVNNAGTVGDRGTLRDTTLEAWRSLFELNLFAAVDLAKRVVPHMRE